MKNPNICCPELPDGKKCDYLDFIYRLTRMATVTGDKHPPAVPVEVALPVRLERRTGPLELGNLVDSATLLPAGVLVNSSRLPEVQTAYLNSGLQSPQLASFSRVNVASLSAISSNQEPTSSSLAAKA
ncbi:MAG: hypothetical protein P8103_13570 [Candidatus Thiodiazotropha sp.]|jgi:hypothetical protein